MTRTGEDMDEISRLDELAGAYEYVSCCLDLADAVNSQGDVGFTGVLAGDCPFGLTCGIDGLMELDLTRIIRGYTMSADKDPWCSHDMRLNYILQLGLNFVNRIYRDITELGVLYYE